MNEDYIKICFLYSKSMNIYGDRGNVIAMQKRAEWRGKKVIIEEYNVGDSNFDFSDIDFFFFGGGQDSQQISVSKDLIKIGDEIKKQVLEKNAALLAICGGMQLLGKYYQPIDGERLNGIGLFDLYTEGGKERFIGNVYAESDLTGVKNDLVGFENHSGRTYVNFDAQKCLGLVKNGRGNNGEDGKEGVVLKNAIGSYLHGSLLPKNPWLADWLLKKSFERRYKDYLLTDLHDEEEVLANKSAILVAKNTTKVQNISSQS